MSGDRGAEIVVLAAKASLDKHVNLELILVGDEEELTGYVTRIVGNEPRLRIRHSTEVVGMSEAPADALRKKSMTPIAKAKWCMADGTRSLSIRQNVYEKKNRWRNKATPACLGLWWL